MMVWSVAHNNNNNNNRTISIHMITQKHMITKCSNMVQEDDLGIVSIGDMIQRQKVKGQGHRVKKCETYWRTRNNSKQLPEKVKQLGQWVCWYAAIEYIHHCHLDYSAHNLIVLQRVVGWVNLGTAIRVHGPCRQHICLVWQKAYCSGFCDKKKKKKKKICWHACSNTAE